MPPELTAERLNRLLAALVDQNPEEPVSDWADEIHMLIDASSDEIREPKYAALIKYAPQMYEMLKFYSKRGMLDMDKVIAIPAMIKEIEECLTGTSSTSAPA